MAFEPGPVNPTVQARLDGAWTDISEDLLEQIAIGRGSSSEAGVAGPSVCAFPLADSDANSTGVAGTYDPYNPASPYYGQWGENTPLRVYLGTEHLGAGGGSGTASTSHVAPSVTATEAGLLVCMWLSDGPIDYTVPVSMTGLTEQDGALNTSVAAYEAVSAGATGTRAATASASREYASVSLVLLGSSLVVEDGQASVATDANVTLTTPSDTEAGWWLVALHGYAWASGATGDMPDAPYGDHGGWIELADSGWISGSPNDLRVRAWVRRVSYAGAQDVIFSGNDDAGLLYNHAALLVVSGDITDWDIRISPEVSSIQHDWTVESDVRADVVASGILRRLQQGSTPLRSAPARYIPGTDPVAYWPLEDGPLSAAGTAEVGQPMRPFVGTHTSGAIVSYPRWGSGSLGPWLPSVVSWSNSDTYSIIWAPVDMSSAFTSQWSIDLIWASGSGAGADDVDTYAAVIDVNPAYLGGSVGWPQLAFSPSTGNVYVSLNGESEVAVSVPGLYDGLGHHVRWQVAQSGSNGQWSLWVDGTIVTIATTSGAMTVTAIERLALVGTPDSRDAAMGYVVVYGQTAPSQTLAARAALGFVGETAGRRFERLCREEGIAVHIVGDPDETESMGPQPLATLVSLLRSCEATDMGIMYEPREVLGLAYRTRRSLYNQPATISADYGGLPAPLNPAADDRFVRNDVTVSRRDGSSARSVQETGSKNVQDPPNGVGRYDTTVTVDAQSDLRLPDLAAWQKHLGTVDERRFPAISAELQGLSVATARNFRGVDVGDRLEVATNLPARLQATGVDQLVLGYTETLTSHTWDWAANGAPTTVYNQVGVYAAAAETPDPGEPKRYSPYNHAVVNGGLMLTGTSGDYASTPDAAALDITGDLDIRAELTLDDWTPSAQPSVVAKYADGQRSFRLQLLDSGSLRLLTSADGTNVLTHDSTAAVTPGSDGRLAVRATIDVNDGGGNRVVRFYTSSSIDGTWTQLGSTVTTAGTTSIFAGTAALEVGSNSAGTDRLLDGIVHAVEVYNGIAGTVVANPDFRAQAQGTTSFADSAGRTWTVHGNAEIMGGAVSGTSTALWVRDGTGGNDPWSTTADFPFDIRVHPESAGAGVRLRVTTISSVFATSVQKLTVSTTVVNGAATTIPPGWKVDLWTPARYAL